MRVVAESYHDNLRTQPGFAGHHVKNALIYGSGSHNWEPHVNQIMDILWDTDYTVICGIYSPVDQLIHRWALRHAKSKPVPIIFHWHAGEKAPPRVAVGHLPNNRSTFMQVLDYFYVYNGEQLKPDVPPLMNAYLVGMAYSWRVILLDGDSKSPNLQTIWQHAVVENADLEVRKQVIRFEKTKKKLSRINDFITVMEGE